MIAMDYTHSAEKVNPDASLQPKFKTRLRSPRSLTELTSIRDDCRNILGTETITCAKKRKQKLTFPQMVHQILEDAAETGAEKIVAWEDNGSSFHIYQPHVFNDTILPKYSKKKTKFRSFQRQLNIYGFKMTKTSGEYRHKFFRRGNMHAIIQIRPRLNLSKKKMNNQDDNDDEIKISNSHISDDEGVEIQASHKVVTPLLLRKIISCEMGESAAKPNRINNDDDLDKCDSYAGCNNDTMDCTPFVRDIHAISLGQDRIISATVREHDFDLFDDINEIKLCNCNGTGYCFTEKFRGC